MSKGGYIRIYFGFCGVVVHFLGNSRQWWIYFGWWWMVVDIFWPVVGGGGHIVAAGGWWWMLVGGGGHILYGGGSWQVVVGGGIVQSNPYKTSLHSLTNIIVTLTEGNTVCEGTLLSFYYFILLKVLYLRSILRSTFSNSAHTLQIPNKISKKYTAV